MAGILILINIGWITQDLRLKKVMVMVGIHLFIQKTDNENGMHGNMQLIIMLNTLLSAVYDATMAHIIGG